MEVAKNMYINLNLTDKDLVIIFTENLGEENKQKCRDYVNDQKEEEEICVSFVICDDDSNYGNFYIKNSQIDLLGIDDILNMLKKLVIFLNRNNIKWDGNKIGFMLSKNEPNYIIDLGPGIGIITKNKFILVYSDKENNILKNDFSLMDKL